MTAVSPLPLSKLEQHFFDFWLRPSIARKCTDAENIRRTSVNPAGKTSSLPFVECQFYFTSTPHLTYISQLFFDSAKLDISLNSSIDSFFSGDLQHFSLANWTRRPVIV